jgi:hypothetical protein
MDGVCYKILIYVHFNLLHKFLSEEPQGDQHTYQTLSKEQKGYQVNLVHPMILSHMISLMKATRYHCIHFDFTSYLI